MLIKLKIIGLMNFEYLKEITGEFLNYNDISFIF